MPTNKNFSKSGPPAYDADFTPYGQEISYTARLQTTACPPNYKFTGYERDSETGLDYAFARYYSSHLGRFLSTDPLGGSIGDLQSHNAYAYTRNNPLNSTDPSGMSDCPDLKFECSDWLGLFGAAGVDLFGGTPGDPLACAWADFWGGDCAIENRMANNVLANIGQLQLQFFLDSLIPPINGFVGDDCNGGPCTPFSYYVGNGCFVSVSYYTVSDIGGQYSMPSLSISCAGGQGRGGRVGGGGGGRAGGSTLDDRANALGNAINKTGVQSLGNPCTIAAFYGLSATGGFGGGAVLGGEAAGAGAAVVEASSPYWPTAFAWAYRQSMMAFAPFIRTTNKVSSAVQNGCNALQ